MGISTAMSVQKTFVFTSLCCRSELRLLSQLSLMAASFIHYFPNRQPYFQLISDWKMYLFLSA